MNEKYECDKCGACCNGQLIVEADWVDLSREPRLLEADRHRADWTLDEAFADLKEPGRALIIAGGSACPFLDGEKHCEIHPTRPTVCVGLEAGDEQCQAARKDAGLPPLEPVPQSRDPCGCELPGQFCCGVPGILAHVEDGKVTADAKVERCDVCSRYPSDEVARAKLVELGIIPEAEAAKERFVVHCFAVVRVTLPVIAAGSHKQAAEQATDRLDWNRDRSSAVFIDEFTEFLVDVEGDTDHARTKYLDREFKEH